MHNIRPEEGILTASHEGIITPPMSPLYRSAGRDVENSLDTVLQFQLHPECNSRDNWCACKR